LRCRTPLAASAPQKKEIRRGNKPDDKPRRASGGAPRREQARNLSITVKNKGAIGKARVSGLAWFITAAPARPPLPLVPRQLASCCGLLLFAFLVVAHATCTCHSLPGRCSWHMMCLLR